MLRAVLVFSLAFVAAVSTAIAAEDIIPLDRVPAAPIVTPEARPVGGDGTSRLVSLNGTWSFKLASDEAEANALRLFHAAGFVGDGFEPIPVPGNWTNFGFEEPHYVNGTTSEGFYRHSFVAPPEVEGRRVLLHFGGVWQSAEVWLNGKLLGRHDSGFTGFAFDAAPALLPGKRNDLAVRVRQQTPLFKLDANDDWALPGIYRDVWLEIMPKEWHLQSVEVVTDFDEAFRDAVLRIRTLVMRNERADFFAPSPPFEVRAILSRERSEVGRVTFTGVVNGAHNSHEAFLELPVSAPFAWTAETPHLYELRVELRRDDTVVHAWEDRIGFREISTADGVFRINGQPVKLRGVARHDQHPEVGRSTRREHWLEDIRLMKAANINAVRTAHYPPAEGFLRLCDELGLYVIAEIPLGFGGDRMSDPSFTEGALLRMHETVKRDRNRPSVVVWSLGNEDPYSAGHSVVLRSLKGLEPTRPVLMPFRYEPHLPPEVDILAPHYWKAEEYDRFAATSMRPVVTTEVSHAFGADDFGEVQERWDALAKHPAGAGSMIWLWADQGLRRAVNGREVLHPMKDKAKITREGSELVREADAGPNEIYDSHGALGTDGIVNADRSPQIDYWETKSAYAPVRVLAERLDFRPGQDFVAVPLRNDYDFTNLSAVTAHWALHRDADLMAEGRTTLSAAPHATTTLNVPTTALAGLVAQSAFTLHLRFVDAHDNEIVARSVLLGDLSPVAVASGSFPLEIAPAKDRVVVTAGPAAYSFDPKTGTLVGLKIDGHDWVDGSDFLLWRPATYSELNVIDRRKVVHAWDTYLQGLPATAESWSVEKAAETVTLRAKVSYRADEENHFVVDYIYRIGAGGALEVSYTVEVATDMDWLLELGIGLRMVDQPFTAEWFGRGPGRNLPNRHGSARIGQWTMPVFSDEARSTRSGVHWLKVHGRDGRALLVSGIEAFRFDGAEKEGESGLLRLLNDLAGAWVKGGPPERPEWRLDLEKGRGTFRGALKLQPLVSAVPEVPAHPAVIAETFINENAPYPECHASTIVELAPGRLGAAWFGGTKERHPDVGIWFARHEDGHWLPAVEVASGVQADGSRLPTWNPVLFAPKDAPLHLFYKVGPSPSKWWGMVITSADGGRTWSAPRRLPEGILGPVKNKPLELADGSWLAASSTEGNPTGWRVHFERSTDKGMTWSKIGPVEKGAGFGFDMIQGSILRHGDGHLQSLGRTRNGVTASTWSADHGLTWSPLAPLSVPNTNSGTDAVTLADGRHLLVFNDTNPPPERRTKGVRYPIHVALSKDGLNWRTVATLDAAPHAAGYAYPAVIQAADGRIHITYTWHRERIKHVVLDPAKL